MIRHARSQPRCHARPRPRRAAALLLAATALLALSGCGRHDKDDDATVSVTTSADGRTVTTVTKDGVTKDGDTVANATSSVELKLPGGFEAHVKGPGNMGAHGHVDIDGVGLYPGAVVGGVQVKVDATADKGHQANVDIGFSAKSDPAAVADWYQQQFEAKGVKAARTGNTLTGASKDGDAFTVTAVANKDGGTAGTIAIRDVK